MITFLFTDVEGSTRHWEKDPRAMREAMKRHDELLAEGIGRHGGKVIVERGEGDSFFAVFEATDDALSAACAVQRALAAEEWPGSIPMRVRMAIHAGEADDRLRGTDVNRCARLRAIAHGSQVLVSDAARDASSVGAVPTDTPRAESRAEFTLLDLGLYRLRDLTRPERVFQLQHPDLPDRFPPLRSLEAFRHNLPVQLTSFIGRERELEELRALVRGQPLVTLVGPGGCGKTRLALQLAADAVEDYADGCWLVDLAAHSDPDLVPAAVARTLEVAEEPGRPLLSTLANHLRGKRLLLLLDNCEHVIGAVSEMTEALARSVPGLRVLATSREPLAIPGELAWPVPSLAIPDAERLPPAQEILDFEAVRLFCDRAATARPGFALTPEDGPTIARICSRLDGIPLAIELAAARVRVLAPEQILARLDDRFRLLTGGGRVLGRHQTLRGAVEWSHHLLTEEERVLFRRLAAFAGPFDLVAAERVGAGEPLEEAEILDLLARLVDKSLLVADQSAEGAVRYRLQETLREYAAERLDEADEVEAVRNRHLAHFLDLAERGYADRIEAEPVWMDRLEQDQDNLRTALAWARDRRPDDHLRLAGALGWFWELHGHPSEGQDHLAATLAHPRPPSPELARALWSAGNLARWRGDAESGMALLEEGRTTYEELGDRLGVALCLQSLGWTMIASGDHRSALLHLEEALNIQLELGTPRLVQLTKAAICQALVALGDVERAEPMAKEILAAATKADDIRNVHHGYHFWADCVLSRNEGTEAERLYAESLRATLDYGDQAEALFEVEGVGMAAACRGEARRGLRLGGAVEARREELGVKLTTDFWEDYRTRFYDLAREHLGPEEAALAWDEGRSMGWETAVEEALAGSRG